MKRLLSLILAASIPFSVIMIVSGCKDEIVPDKALVDSMNKQRGAMSKNLPNNGASTATQGKPSNAPPAGGTQTSAAPGN